METVSIDDAELQYVEMFRVALSEEDNAQRMQAIENVKHDVKSKLIEQLFEERGTSWMSNQKNAELVQWLARSAAERNKAVYELSQTMRRYEGRNGNGNERKLNIAEYIGRQVWLSICEGKFTGVQTVSGILQQVREHALENGVSGARDRDTLAKIWGMYRGVAHLGLAMDLCDEKLNAGLNILDLAEHIRCDFSQNCPKGTSKPYVDRSFQIFFIIKQCFRVPDIGIGDCRSI